MRAPGALIVGALTLSACRPPATVTVQAEPATAKIYRVTQAGDTLVGTGTGQVIIAEPGPTAVVVRADGYEPERRPLSKLDAGKPPMKVRLTTRVVSLTVLPYDAEAYVDGRLVGTGQRNVSVRIDSGATRSVEIRKTGFKTIKRTYANRGGSDVPPASETIELGERSALLTVSPSAASIESNGKQLGVGNADITIPHNGCTTVRAAMRGYKSEEYTFCQKDGVEEPQPRYEKVLMDREVTVTTQPPSAAITVGGQAVGSGEYKVVVRRDACVTVEAALNAYLRSVRTYCDQDNTPTPVPSSGEDFLKLDPDEAWPASVESDQANVNFEIDVNSSRKPDDAWKTISQIITSAFDVLEVTDKETGYLRTGWNVRSFKGSAIRTRVILKLASSSPLKYTLKLVSEEQVAGPNGRIDIKDDQQFHPYPRILLQYKDLINEAQTRLR